MDVVSLTLISPVSRTVQYRFVQVPLGLDQRSRVFGEIEESRSQSCHRRFTTNNNENARILVKPQRYLDGVEIFFFFFFGFEQLRYDIA